MKEIKVLLLQGGLEVIAEVEEHRGVALSLGGDIPINGYTLYKPYRILPVPLIQQSAEDPRKININIAPQLVPLMGAAIQTWLTLKPSDIIGLPMDASKNFESAYVQRTTGLQLAG